MFVQVSLKGNNRQKQSEACPSVLDQSVRAPSVCKSCELERITRPNFSPAMTTMCVIWEEQPRFAVSPSRREEIEEGWAALLLLIGADVSAVTAFSYAWRNLVFKGTNRRAVWRHVTGDLFQLWGAWEDMRMVEKKKETVKSSYIQLGTLGEIACFHFSSLTPAVSPSPPRHSCCNTCSNQLRAV